MSPALLFLLQAAAPAAAAPPSAPPSVDLPAPLARVLRAYERAWGARDAAALADLFTEDGFVLAQQRPPVRGRAAIREAYTGAGGPLTLRAYAFRQEGSLAVILGGYAAAAGAPDAGKFTLTLHLGPDGHWRIFSDMDNGVAPPRPPAPTPPPQP